MSISHDTKKILLVFIPAIILFLLLKPGDNRQSEKVKGTPAEQKKNANTVADAYIAALMDQRTSSELEELNRLSEKQYGLRAYQKDNKVYVKDVNGNDIKMS